MKLPQSGAKPGTKPGTKGTMLITGAARGIGAATARLAVQQGWRVVLNVRQHSPASKALLEDIKRAGGEAFAIAADVSDHAQVLRLFEQLDEYLQAIPGNARLDALVNNAGVVDLTARVEDYTPARLERMFGINVFGAFYCAAQAIKRMSTAHGGAGGVIVNVSSAAARLGGAGQYVDYAASKAALDCMTLGLGKEVAAQGIRVNAVRPGLIDTEIHASGGNPDRVAQLCHAVPMQRGGTAEEVAQSIVWLCSDAASYVTTALLDVSGGR